MFKAYSLDQAVPTTLTVQFLCKAKSDDSSISVATKELKFVGQGEFVSSEEQTKFYVGRPDVYFIWMYVVATSQCVIFP